MAKVKAQGSHKPLLSTWEAPSNAGSPIGVLATTFTLDTGLFEEECLARFAGVQSDPYRDGALYRIEREEKLASLMCAVVVADVHHCSGQRSLRWDLLPSRPKSGVMHAKISLLVWEKHIRVIVGSANLTSAGYRQNQECVACLDFQGRVADGELLDPILDFLREILDTTAGTARARALRLLEWVSNNVERVVGSRSKLRRRFIPISPGKDNAFDQMDRYLPTSRPHEAHVVSPFFDQTARKFGPAHRLWEMLRQRGGAELHVHVAGTYAEELGKWRLQVPAHLFDVKSLGRPGVSMPVHPIAVTKVQTEAGEENRPLHAKSLTLRHPAWVAWMVGSSNFTSAGLGVVAGSGGPRVVNYEANVLFYFLGDESETLYEKIASGGHRGMRAVDRDSEAELTPDPGQEDGEGDMPPPLPGCFKEANLVQSDMKKHVVQLLLDPALAIPAEWRVLAGGHCVLDSVRWLENGKSSECRVTLDRDGPPPSSLLVAWEHDGKQHAAEWPVNVERAAVLPPPEELRDLSLAALLELLSSARPLYETVRGWQRRQVDDDEADGFDAFDIIDPHQKVDTSGFLVKRVQRACAALNHVRDQLKAPLLSESALAWRLDGPVGARAVIAAIRKECRSDLPDEWAFLLSEVVRELQTVELTLPGGAPATQEFQTLFDSFIEELRVELSIVVCGASAEMRRFVEPTKEHPKREVA